MPTPGASDGGVGAAAKRVADHARQLASLHAELATIELKRKGAALGIGAALLAGAALFGLFGLGFLFATIAAALATVLATWLALLLTTALLFLLAGVLAAIGIGRFKKGSPPVPEQAIAEAKLTTEVVKS